MSGDVRRTLVAIGMGLVLGLVSCGGGGRDLLVVYTGDCQGYTEPCG